MTPDLAINTAVSFATTTWQAYAGETTMSYLSQLLGLAAQNFLAGAAGLAVGIAFIRGFARQGTTTLGNFWVDLVRAMLWVLLPLALIGSSILIWQGVPMNFSPYTHVKTLEGGIQIIAQGPVAALEFIKNLGTGGGGFFNVNGAHPYKNPTPLTYTFGLMVGNARQGWMLFWVMMVLFVGGLAFCSWAELQGTGIYSIIMVALVGLFLTGLMIGRTPEYLGKKIAPSEMKLLALYTLLGPFAVVPFFALAVVTPAGLAGLTTNAGPHGLTEILNAYASSMDNNGQTFASLNANSLFYNSTTTVVMLLGRFGLAIPALLFAGLFATQTSRPFTPGKLRTDSVLFAIVVIFAALIVVGLTYFAVLALGPVIE